MDLEVIFGVQLVTNVFFVEKMSAGKQSEKRYYR